MTTDTIPAAATGLLKAHSSAAMKSVFDKLRVSANATNKLDDIGIDIDNLRQLLEIGIGIMMDISGAGEHEAEINRVLSLLMVSRDVAAKAFADIADVPDRTSKAKP